MTRQELAAKLAETNDMSAANADKLLQQAFNTIAETMAGGEDVKLPGFGTFEIVDKPARQGRNPRTGEPMEIAASRAAKFKPFKQLKDALNA